ARPLTLPPMPALPPPTLPLLLATPPRLPVTLPPPRRLRLTPPPRRLRPSSPSSKLPLTARAQGSTTARTGARTAVRAVCFLKEGIRSDGQRSGRTRQGGRSPLDRGGLPGLPRRSRPAQYRHLSRARRVRPSRAGPHHALVRRPRRHPPRHRPGRTAGRV